MADLRDAIRFAGALNPLLAPLSFMADASYSMFPAEKPRQRPVGTVVSYLNKQPFEIYAGEDYGPQSLGSYLKLRQQSPSKFPLPAGFKVPQTQKKPPAAAESREGPATTNPDWNNPPGGAGGTIVDPTTTGETPQSTSAEGFGTDVRKPATEPGFESLSDLIEKLTSEEFLKSRTSEQLRSFAVQTALSQALGAEKSRERYKREVELERIKSWTDMYKTAQQTNMLSQAMLGQALIASQQPNANVADILSKGATAAQSAIGGFKLGGA